MPFRRLVPYGLAALGVGIAVVVRWAMGPALGTRFPFATFFVAVLLAAWFGGLGPGTLAIVLSFLVNLYLLGPDERPRPVAFLIVTGVLVLVYGSLRSAKDHADLERRNAVDARVSAERARERARFLADANITLAASLDRERVLATLAQLVLQSLADWCAIDLVESEDLVRRVQVGARETTRTLTSTSGILPPDPEGRHPRSKVLRTGRPQLFVDVAEAQLQWLASDPAHLRALRARDRVSAMMVPLVARGRTLGVVTCVTGAAERRYEATDLSLAEDLAIRAAVALENALLYSEAQAARGAAEEATRAKDQFLSVVSHELKTPLSAMVGWLDVLRFGKPAQASRAMETIERSMRVQLKLIDDLLDVSRIVTGRLRLHVQTLDLVPLVEEVVQMMRSEAAAKGVAIEVELDPLGDSVVGDADRLQQVFSNLLSNAVKFTPAGGTIGVRLQRIDAHAELAVWDTGRGISADFLPHVFERFRQAEPVTSREKGGLGLGLAITQHLVTLHGGTIAASSDGEGKGARFTVVLPFSGGAADTSPARAANDTSRRPHRRDPA